MIFSAYLHILLALLVAMSGIDSTLLQQQPLQHDGRGMEMVAGAASNAEVDAANKFISAADNRNDGEYRTCVIKYQVNVETIIRTQDSKALGARYINETEVESQEDCLLWCCQTEYCNVAIFERKERGSCYLFDCGPLNDFKCKFAPHHQYMSAILDTSNFDSEVGYNQQQQQQQQQQHHTSDAHKANNVVKQTQAVDEHIVALKNLKHQVTVNTEASGLLQSTSTVKIEMLLSTVKPQTTTIMNTITSVVPNQPQHSFNANGDALVEGLVVAAVGRCSHFQFQCRSTKECIAVYNACDGIPQCADGSDESDELGCPTEGRRFANGGVVVAESTLATAVSHPTLHQQQQQSVGSLSDNRPLPNKISMKNNEEDDERHVSNPHHKVMENMSGSRVEAAAAPYGRSNKAQVMDERYQYDSNVVKNVNNDFQSTDQRQNDYHSKPIAHVNDNNNNNQGHSRLINERPLPLHNQHQLNSERNRYEDNGGRFQAVEEEPIPNPHSEGYQGEENIAALRNQHAYNRQQMPSQYKSLNELGGDSSSYDNRHYDIPQAPRNYMKEYYEGGNGGPAANPIPSGKENFQYKTNNNGLQREMMYNNEKPQGSKANNGDWNTNLNHYPPQLQQPQMYEGRNEAVNDNYQYPEADISPVHVHVNVHQSEMERQINHNKSPVNIQDKHLGGEYVKNNGNEEAMNPSIKESNDNWNYSPQLNQGRLLSPNNFQMGQKVNSQVAQNKYPEVVSMSTQKMETTTTTTLAPNHQATGSKIQTKQMSASIIDIKSLTRIQKKLQHNEVDAIYAQRSSESSGAIVALTLGLSITGLLLVLVGCRLRMVRRRLRKGRGPYAHDADYLVNGMYL